MRTMQAEVSHHGVVVSFVVGGTAGVTPSELQTPGERDAKIIHLWEKVGQHEARC